MNNDLIFLPVLAHILLIFIVYIYLGRVKTRAIEEGNVDRQKASLNSKAWPEYVVKVSNNLDNQFESPILFYMLSIIYYLTNHVSSVLVLIMGGYVLSRYIHAYVHVTSNYVPYRYKFFVIGLLTLLALTLWLVFKLIGL
ncbi:MAG: MAPEG family protein [Pseudomonadales bacterium]|nr:MAPEG family protein [Pseudomonadales bacterium]